MNGYSFDAVIFDLDGVITKTALVHSKAWKRMFDNYLMERQSEFNEPFEEFTHEHDYLTHIDGKPRYQGVKSFLQSRKIDIPYGAPSDTASGKTVCGLGNRKNRYFAAILSEEGVEKYQTTVDLINTLKEQNIKIGVASSSKNCRMVLERVDLLDLFDTRVDGTTLADLGLKGKPSPDIFLETCSNLNTTHDRAVIVEDAVSGVLAGKNGNFGLVIGVARENNHDQLKAAGADIVISDLGEISLDAIEAWFRNNR